MAQQKYAFFIWGGSSASVVGGPFESEDARDAFVAAAFAGDDYSNPRDSAHRLDIDAPGAVPVITDYTPGELAALGVEEVY